MNFAKFLDNCVILFSYYYKQTKIRICEIKCWRFRCLFFDLIYIWNWMLRNLIMTFWMWLWRIRFQHIVPFFEITSKMGKDFYCCAILAWILRWIYNEMMLCPKTIIDILISALCLVIQKTNIFLIQSKMLWQSILKMTYAFESIEIILRRMSTIWIMFHRMVWKILHNKGFKISVEISEDSNGFKEFTEKEMLRALEKVLKGFLKICDVCVNVWELSSTKRKIWTVHEH